MGLSQSVDYTQIPKDAVNNILSFLDDDTYSNCNLLSKDIREAYLEEMLRRYKNRRFFFLTKSPERCRNRGYTMVCMARRRGDMELWNLLYQNTSPDNHEQFLKSLHT